MFAMIMAPCVRCRRVITFNPNKVPSIRITPDGPKEPLCLDCHTHLNQARKSMNLEPWPEPLPGAYDAAPEEEIYWGDD